MSSNSVSAAERAGGAYHWREYGIRDILPNAEGGQRILLLGCGDGGERPMLRELGFHPLGLDIRVSESVDVIADAHLLPMSEAAFDVVLSMQVLEHLHSPWRSVEEVARVLRPGGVFVGSVAFLKPYHGSYFHMTHLGVKHLLELAGLKTDFFAGAQSLSYSLYGGLIPIGTRTFRRRVFGAVDRLLFGARALAWSLARGKSPDANRDRPYLDFPMSFRSFDRLRFAPAVVFRARKPA